MHLTGGNEINCGMFEGLHTFPATHQNYQRQHGRLPIRAKHSNSIQRPAATLAEVFSTLPMNK